jgi:8-oxo-dGTP pyrophosphatase MutT (NUDIX family)
MRKLWHTIGRIAFFACIPLLHIYLRSHKRTRVLVVSEDKVLLVKGWLGSGKWILPGGGRHYGESAESAVLRELQEETGIVLNEDALQDIGEAHFAHYGLRYTYQQFITTLPKPITPKLRRLEIIDAVWMPLADINDTIVDRDVMALVQEWKRSH